MRITLSMILVGMLVVFGSSHVFVHAQDEQEAAQTKNESTPEEIVEDTPKEDKARGPEEEEKESDDDASTQPWEPITLDDGPSSKMRPASPRVEEVD